MTNIMYDYRYILCGAISKAPHDKLLHITNNCLSCEAKLLHMKYFAPQTLSAASATIMMYAWIPTFHILKTDPNLEVDHEGLPHINVSRVGVSLL